MVNPTMEVLRQADEAFAQAGIEYAEKYAEVMAAQQRVFTAQDVEAIAGRRQVEAYQAAFAGGIVIERILAPTKIEYMAGMKSVAVGGIFGGYEDELVWLSVDKGHAAKLKNSFAHSVYVGNRLGFRVTEENFKAEQPGEQPGLHMSFSITSEQAGYKNSKTPEEVWIPSWWSEEQKSTTDYHGPLEAIKWRLPTEEEIRRFGNLVTQAEAAQV